MPAHKSIKHLPPHTLVTPVFDLEAKNQYKGRVIKIDNDFTKLCFKMNVWEARIMYYVILKINRASETEIEIDKEATAIARQEQNNNDIVIFKPYKVFVPYREISKNYLTNKVVENNQTKFKNAVSSLHFVKFLGIKNTSENKQKQVDFPLLHKTEFEIKNLTGADLLISPEALKYILKVGKQKCYTEIDYYLAMCITKSMHTGRIYMLLKSEKFKSKGFYECTIEEFKQMCAVDDKYNNITDLIKRVIVPAQEEMAKLFAFSFTLETKKDPHAPQKYSLFKFIFHNYSLTEIETDENHIAYKLELQQEAPAPTLQQQPIPKAQIEKPNKAVSKKVQNTITKLKDLIIQPPAQVTAPAETFIIDLQGYTLEELKIHHNINYSSLSTSFNLHEGVVRLAVIILSEQHIASLKHKVSHYLYKNELSQNIILDFATSWQLLHEVASKNSVAIEFEKPKTLPIPTASNGNLATIGTLYQRAIGSKPRAKV